MIVHTSTEWELFFSLYRSRNSRKVLISFLLFSSFFSIAVTTTYAILNGFFEEQPISSVCFSAKLYNNVLRIMMIVV